MKGSVGIKNKVSYLIAILVFVLLVSVKVYATTNQIDIEVVEMNTIEAKVLEFEYKDEHNALNEVEHIEIKNLASENSKENKRVDGRSKLSSPARGNHTRKTQTSYTIPKNIDLIERNQKEKLKKVENTKKKQTKENESFYIENISMPKEHQEFLYEECKKQNIDFKKVMALISLESSFNNQTISKTNDYGYMQINIGNHKNLAKILSTKNAPLDPHINIKWGTHMLGTLYSQWREQGISEVVQEGEIFSKLDKYVMSSYNKGVSGFKKNGMATKYINIAETKYKELYR